MGGGRGVMGSWATTDEVERLKVICNDYDLALGRAQAQIAALTAALKEIRRTSHDGTSLETAHKALDGAGGA